MGHCFASEMCMTFCRYWLGFQGGEQMPCFPLLGDSGVADIFWELVVSLLRPTSAVLSQWLVTRRSTGRKGMQLVFCKCPAAKVISTQYRISYHVRHSIKGFDVHLITSADWYDIQRFWCILYVAKLQPSYFYYFPSPNGHHSGHWGLPRPILMQPYGLLTQSEGETNGIYDL